MSSTFSLAEVTAEYLNSPSKLHLCIYLQAWTTIPLQVEPADPRSPPLPQTFTCGWAPSPRHNFEASVLPHWTDATHAMTQPVMPQTCLSFKSRYKKIKKNFSATRHNQEILIYLKNSFFFRISQITKFITLRRLPPSNMSGFDIAPIYFQKHTKMSNFSYSFAKKF